MPRRCKVGGCSTTAGVSKVPLHQWPTNESQASRWLAFVKSTRADKFTLSPASTYICALHFDSGMFDNLLQFQIGLKNKLQLVQAAVPTIKDRRAGPLAKHFAVDSTGKTNMWVYNET